MIHYSVLIPQRDAAEAVDRLLPSLTRALDALLLPYEIICIDDASAWPAAQRLEELLARYPHLRVLHFDRPRGTSAALTAGLAAARGDLVFGVDSNADFAPRYLPHLVARLSQHDLVVTQQCDRRRPLGHRIARPLRLLAGRPDLHATEQMLWAARREAVGGLALARGAFRIFERIVARRGFRVCRLRLSDDSPPRGSTHRSGLVDRLAAGWLNRRFEPHLASEMVRVDRQPSHLTPARYDAARPRYVPQPVITPLANTSKESPGSAEG
jgi:glycosyltransferase involved in cell wall biosynthesis